MSGHLRGPHGRQRQDVADLRPQLLGDDFGLGILGLAPCGEAWATMVSLFIVQPGLALLRAIQQITCDMSENTY